MAKKKHGKIFEQDIETSCVEQGIFYFRVRDVNLPLEVRKMVKLPQNKYDALIYRPPILLTLEMKSTKDKSISFSEKIIKANQIKSLVEANTYEGVVAGFLMNFREPENKAYFVPIDKFVEYKNIVENQLEHTYESKTNKKSIPIGICEEIGVEVTNIKKKVRYRYYINRMIDDLIGLTSKVKRSG